NRTDTASRTSDDDRPAFGRQPVPFQRHDRQHRGVARRANGHCLACAHCLGQWHQPVAPHARLLCVAAEMRLAATPAVENDFVTWLPVAMRVRFNLASEVYA